VCGEGEGGGASGVVCDVVPEKARGRVVFEGRGHGQRATSCVTWQVLRLWKWRVVVGN